MKLSSAIRRRPPTRPESSTKRIQRAMSLTLDQTAPAGATTSTGRLATTCTVASIVICGEATLGKPIVAATVGTVSRIPIGVQIRVRNISLHDDPVAERSTSPAMAYCTFWYAYRLRNDAAGLRNRIRRMISSRP